MEIVTLKTKSRPSTANRTFKGSLRAFDLPTIIGRMKQRSTWLNGELTAMILLKSRYRQILLTALREETEINSYQSNDSVTFQIIEGKLELHTRKESVTLDEGQLLTLHEKINYCLTANEDTVFLLTIANSTMQPTVN